MRDPAKGTRDGRAVRHPVIFEMVLIGQPVETLSDYRSWFAMLLRTAPSRLWTAWKVWRKYR